MLNSLRVRLWLTYVLLIGVVGGIFSLVLGIYLLRNPLVDRQVVQRLVLANQLINNRLEINTTPMQPVRLRQALIRADEALDVRLLILSPEREILIDSRADRAPAINPRTWAISTPAEGTIRDSEGKFWLYAARSLENDFFLVAASLRPNRVAGLFYAFRDDLLTPLSRAGVLAALLALLLSLVMARWISNPLQRMINSARSVSEGSFQPLALEGPSPVQDLARAMNEMGERVRMSQQSQRDFIANISHELKTPLTSIQGFAHAIMDGTAKNGDSVKQSAEVIYSEAARMDRLVADLLDLARLDAGTAELKREAINLNLLLQRMVTKFTPQAASAQVTIQVDLQEVPALIGDQDRLAQVFTNLLDNAIKFTNAGGVVKVESKMVGGNIHISIADSGPGIPSEEISRIFERFYQLDKSRRGGPGRGAGLGLAIGQEIIHQHGGEISVESQPGEGSVFLIQLPPALPDDTTLAVRRRREV